MNDAQIDALTWSPNERRLASVSQDGSLKVFAATDGAELLMFHFDEDIPKQITWSPDGHRLAAATESGNIHVWDAGRGYEFQEGGPRQSELATEYSRMARSVGNSVGRHPLHEFLRLTPDTLGQWEARGHANARMGEYGRAAQEFAKAIGPDLQLCVEPAFYRAFALLGSGDDDAYREFCASLVKTFRDSDVPSNRRDVAWLCALSANPPADSTTVLEMARALHDHQTTPESGDGGILVIGASLFLDGQYDEAIDTLTRLAQSLTAAVTRPTNPNWHAPDTFLRWLVNNRDTTFRLVESWPTRIVTQTPIDK